ncbi:hypothetical protein ACFCXR_23840 [Streptomyces noursei]|uniref:hypothetical protein n=1 Tax=Streptomyces noursei TaxID=1971 RepID=UPI0035D74465
MTDSTVTLQDDSDRRLLLQEETRPAVESGRYKVTVTTEVSGSGVTAGGLPPASHELTVAGPRYALDAATVDTLYPPPGSSGDYRRTMAHLSLTEPTLPWQRDARASHASDTARPPWLALLVLSKGEAPINPDTGKATVQRTIKDFMDQCKAAQGEVLLPDLGEEELPKGLTNCSTIDVSAEVFTDVLPRRQEIGNLVFVRRVLDKDRLWADKTTAPATNNEHARALVLSARLPATPGPYSAHLVSLEGLGDYLDGAWPLKRGGTTIQQVRLLSLYSWSFHHAPDARGSFEDAVNELVDNNGDDAMLLRLPVPGGCAPNAKDSATGAAARRRLCAGYVPVTHRLSTGEETFAWYRGPFTPVTAEKLPRSPENLHYESDALAYDQAHGVFDVSYASAFTLGRFLLLSDPALNQALSVLRKDVHNTLHVALAQGAARQGPDGQGARTVMARALDAAAEAGTASSPRVARHLRVTGGARRDFETLLATRTARAGRGVPVGKAPQQTHTDAARLQDTRTALRAAAQLPASNALAALVSHVVDQHVPALDEALCARRLLAALPLDHLVPDRRMLPPESIRFFAVDGGWLSVMLAGALRMGQATSLDHAATTHLHTRLLQNANLPPSGMLVRSRVVRDWPSLIVEATVQGSNGSGSVLYNPPRRVAPDLLLVFFTQDPDQVVLRRPAEQPHYGLDGEQIVNLRDLSDPTTLGHASTSTCNKILDLRRTGCTSKKPTEVLTVLTTGTNPSPCLNRALCTALKDHGLWYTTAPDKDRRELTSAEQGLQLLDTTHRLVLKRANRGFAPTVAEEATP